MQLSANKGEWSEFYAFLKILVDKRLYSADESFTLLPNSFLEVISIIRREGIQDIEYEIRESQNEILIKSKAEVLARIPFYEVTGKLATILKKIKNGSDTKGAFAIVEAQDLMSKLYCKKVKPSSTKKPDISLKIQDPKTGTKPIQNFSIKSKLGGKSTLFNASASTNFEFEIVPQKERLSFSDALIGLNENLKESEDLRFVGLTNANFRKNLTMIDSKMPEIMAEMIKAYYLGVKTSVEELTMHVKRKDPLEVSNHNHFYEHKIQEFLMAVAFGMQPSKLWNGSYEQHGGYIVVKDNGELACYHVYDRDKFRRFLFTNTKFETPSRSRHKFGSIYEREGKRYIKLNLQIRFKN